MKPYAASCDENREPILAVLKDLLPDCQALLEIGSGTGDNMRFILLKSSHNSLGKLVINLNIMRAFKLGWLKPNFLMF